MVDGSSYSGKVRLDIIDRADKYIYVSYYTLINDESMEIMFKSLMDAADRGVEVNILLDGIFNSFKRDYRNCLYMFDNHPNVSFKYYEPLNLLKPWTWNNRLHDKMIIVDDKYALIGGRNIGNKYFLEESADIDLVRDRDVLIYNPTLSQESIISNMKGYYEYVWNHKYSKKPRLYSLNGRKKAEKYRTKIDDEYVMYNYKFRRDEFFDWDSITKTVKHIEFTHNPIQRLNKEPWGLKRILELTEESKESIFTQSPYIVPTRNMKKIAGDYNINYKIINILTNSFKSSPNFPAISGYYNIRKEIYSNVGNLYEYQGNDSIHGKTYIFDDKKSIIGSFNLDSRSSYLSTESYVIIEDENFASELKDVLDVYIDKSLKVSSTGEYIPNESIEMIMPSKIKMVIIKILSKVLYLFDYML